jgi:hypothetical protein
MGSSEVFRIRVLFMYPPIVEFNAIVELMKELRNRIE